MITCIGVRENTFIRIQYIDVEDINSYNPGKTPWGQRGVLVMLRFKNWLVSHSSDSHPRELVVEVTNKCNYRCIYCFRNLMEEPEGYMDTGLFHKIIGDARESGVEKIVFTGWGEPLLHPDIKEFAEAVKDNGMSLLLNTNGYFLGDHVEWVKELVDELYISLDSSESNLYSVLRKGGDLSRVIEAVERINRYRRETLSRKPEITVQFTLTRLNIDNLESTINLAGQLKATRFIVSNILPLTPGQEKSLACYMDPECREKVSRLSTRLARLSMIHNIIISMPQLGLSTERECPYAARDALYVRWDGKVTPCIYMAHGWRNTFYGITRTIKPVILGDLREEGLMDIWRSQEFTRFKFTLDTMHFPSCPDCPLREYCTFTLTNETDCWGNQPSCASCPYSRDMVRCPL